MAVHEPRGKCTVANARTGREGRNAPKCLFCGGFPRLTLVFGRMRSCPLSDNFRVISPEDFRILA